MYGQNEILPNLFDFRIWDYSHDKTFFDEDRCEINNNYNNIFIVRWKSLEQIYKIAVSSSGPIGFPQIYLDFVQKNIFTITIWNEYKTGIYKFDENNKLLYLRINGFDYVFSIKYYKYNGKELKYYNYKNVLELYLCINSTWDTVPTEILKLDKIFYQRFIEE